MQQHWGWLIVIYLFLGGLGAGAYLTSFAAGKGWLGHSPALRRTGYYLAAPVVAIGTLLLVFDLGQGLKKPWLLFGLIMNPRSVMTWGVYILACFILVGLVVGYFAWKRKEIPQGLLYAGAVLALGTGTYTGLLIAVVKAVPLWNTFLMPVLFVVSALSTGMSATSLLAYLVEKTEETDERKICQLHLVLVATEIILLGVLFGSLLSGMKGGVALQSAEYILFGPLAVPFWLLLVGVGLVVPLCVFAYNYQKLTRFQRKRPIQLEFVPAASTSQDETAATSMVAPDCTRSILTIDTGVIIGGFVLRLLVIFAAFPVWNGLLQ